MYEIHVLRNMKKSVFTLKKQHEVIFESCVKFPVD